MGGFREERRKREGNEQGNKRVGILYGIELWRQKSLLPFSKFAVFFFFYLFTFLSNLYCYVNFLS